jgi:hypothetical protein
MPAGGTSREGWNVSDLTSSSSQWIVKGESG